MGKQKERSVSSYLVIALLSRNTLTLSSPGISIYPGHTVDDIRIQPIEHITQSPRETEQDVTIRRLDRPRLWMLELATMYPYGLNDRLQHVGTFHIPMFDPGTMCLIFLIVINAVNGAMDGEVTPDATRKSHWTNFAIFTTEVRVMVAYVVFELLFIAPGYQIYTNYLLNVNG